MSTSKQATVRNRSVKQQLQFSPHYQSMPPSLRLGRSRYYNGNKTLGQWPQFSTCHRSTSLVSRHRGNFCKQRLGPTRNVDSNLSKTSYYHARCWFIIQDHKWTSCTNLQPAGVAWYKLSIESLPPPFPSQKSLGIRNTLIVPYSS